MFELIKLGLADETYNLKFVQRKGVYLKLGVFLVPLCAIVENRADIVLSLVTEMLVLLDVVLAVFSTEGNGLDFFHCKVFIKEDREIADDDCTDRYA